MRRTMPLGELILLAITRVMLGAGVGLLLSKRLGDDQREAVGLTLLLVGVITTVPLGLDIARSSE